MDYEWVWDYANTYFEYLFAVGKELDDKANDIIKYLGGGTGIFTIAVLANATPANRYIIASAVPSFLMALVSIYFAVLARQPSETCLPAGIKSAFNIAGTETDAKRAKAKFIGQWHEASIGVLGSNEIKAERVQVATWVFFAAICLLLLPLLWVILGTAISSSF